MNINRQDNVETEPLWSRVLITIKYVIISDVMLSLIVKLPRNKYDYLRTASVQRAHREQKPVRLHLNYKELRLFTSTQVQYQIKDHQLRQQLIC